MRDTEIPRSVSFRLGAFSIAAFVLAMSVACHYITIEDSAWRQEKRLAASQIAVIQASSIEHRILLALSAAKILGHEVKLHQGELINFEPQAANLIASLGNITNLQLAPDGIIEHIYPLQGHEKVLGQDIFARDRRRIAADRAVDTQQLIVDGPFELFQGGWGVIGRYAVFLEDRDGAEIFWGFSSVLITLDDLISATDLPMLVEKGYHYQLSHLNPDSDEQEVFIRSHDSLQGEDIAFDIDLPDKVWTLTLSVADQETHGPQYLWHLGLALFFSSLIAFLVYVLLKQPIHLRSLVASRTLELQKSTQELRGERSFLSTLLNTIPDLVFYKDNEGAYLGCNKAMEAAIGLSSDSLIGLKGVDVVSDYPNGLAIEQRVLTEHETQKDEAWVTLMNGSKVFLEIIKTPFLDPDGSIAGLIGISRDVTARKHDEEALRSVQKRLEFLLSVTSAVIYTCQPTGDGKIIYVSDNVYYLLGYPPQAFIEDPEFWINHVHSEDRDRVLTERQAVFDNSVHLMEYRFLHRDGRYRWMRDELRLVRESSHSPLEVVGCVIDVTSSNISRPPFPDTELSRQP